MPEQMTKDVEVMLGHTKQALIAMAVPVIISNIVQSLNNIIDTVWVSGLGPGALTAVGVAFPFFFIMMGLGNGVAVGASQALARRIGAMDRKGVNSVAAQAFMMTVVLSIVLAIVFTVLAGPLMEIGSAGEYYDECLAYSVPIFIGAPVILLGCLFSGLLRSEGASRRSMIIHVAAALLNIVLDPIFIFGLDMGIAGAAWATVIAMALPLVVTFYWYFGKQDTFARIPLKGFRFDLKLDWDILRVGIPASMEMILMSLTAIAMNAIISSIDPLGGVAIYSTGWKVIDIFMIPVMSIGFSIVPIAAAAVGAKKPEKIKEVFLLAIKYGFGLMLILSIFLAVFAPYIMMLFTYTEESAALAPELINFVRISCIFLPLLPLSFTSSGLFQSLGMGMKSFVCTAFMNFVRLPICFIFAGIFATLTSIWWGVVIGEYAGAALAIGLGIFVLRKALAGKYEKLHLYDDGVF